MKKTYDITDPAVIETLCMSHSYAEMASLLNGEIDRRAEEKSEPRIKAAIGRISSLHSTLVNCLQVLTGCVIAGSIIIGSGLWVRFLYRQDDIENNRELRACTQGRTVSCMEAFRDHDSSSDAINQTWHRNRAKFLADAYKLSTGKDLPR